MVKIGISGTFGVGKSVLARLLGEELRLPVIGGAAASVAVRLGVKDVGEFVRDKSLAREFLIHVLSEQVAAENACPDGFVSDGTALDCLACWLACGLNGSELGRTYRARCLSRRYDVVLYVPLSQNSRERQEEFASDFQKFRFRVDQALRMVLFRFKLVESIVVEGSAREGVALTGTVARVIEAVRKVRRT
nr:AAA family ATPase [Thermanaeromonas toyohensis]